MTFHRIIAVGAALLVTSCTLGTPSTPSLSGPSVLGTSIMVTASPDLVARDGVTQSVITVTVLDQNSRPVRNQALRMDVKIGNALGDLGTLSARNISTGSDGRANVIYTAPPPAAFGVSNDAMIQVVATPVGTDAANTTTSAVSIHLTAPGVIQPPNGVPVPSFFVSPSSPRERENAVFDGSASKDSDGKIVSYQWNFGDGTTSSSGPTATHAYGIAGSYQVTLTVTDDRGLSATSAPTAVNVVAAVNPTAAFVYSPTAPRVTDTVSFNASASSVPPGRQIQTWEWDFGDGSPVTTTTSPTTTHVYAVAKTYTVVLVVTDDIGRRGTVTVTIAINP